jgi:hypothetical protein
MDVAGLLTDLFGRVREHVHEAVDGATQDTLTTPPADGTNPIAWLVWHLTRVEDAHGAEILGREQVWTGGDWASRFGTAADPGNHGYGHSWEQVIAVRPDAAALLEYHAAVAAQTDELLATLDGAALDRIVDDSYDPPVSLGVRLVSIVDDEIQHAGQAVYARGMLERAR